jgi:hypothetical protein
MTTIPIDLLKGKDFTRSENGLTPIAWLKRPQPLYYAINDKASYGRDLEAYQEHKERCAATSFPLCGELPQKETYVLGVDFEVEERYYHWRSGKYVKTSYCHLYTDHKLVLVAVPLSPKEETKTTNMNQQPLPTQSENPKGLHQRYYIQKIVKRHEGDFYPPQQNQYALKEIDEGAEYFIMRLDEGGSDPKHIAACRIGVHAYADAIESHIPQLAKDLRERYPLQPLTQEESKEEENEKYPINLKTACHLFNVIEGYFKGEEYYGVEIKNDEQAIAYIEAVLNDNFIRKEAVAPTQEREEKEREAVTLLRRVMLKIINREYELPQSEQSDPFAFTDAQNYLSNP